MQTLQTLHKLDLQTFSLKDYVTDIFQWKSFILKTPF